MLGKKDEEAELAGKNYCPKCGNRMKHYKCHVCGYRMNWGKRLRRTHGKKWKYEEKQEK